MGPSQPSCLTHSPFLVYPYFEPVLRKPGLQVRAWCNSSVQLQVKQDINFVELLDTVTLTAATAARLGLAQPVDAAEHTLDVKGGKNIFTVASETESQTLATFGDGSPAVIRTGRGQGAAYYFGFHIGLAYYSRAVPFSHGRCCHYFIRCHNPHYIMYG